MKLEYIHEFYILAHNGNYLDSAEQLFMSQSTLTRHMQALEAELGVPLFTRATHKVELSAFGQSFLPYAQQIDNTMLTFQKKLSAESGIVQSRIRIGAIPMMIHYNITDLLVKFKKFMPEVSLEITEAESSVLKDMLRRDECDFAFVREIGETEPEFNVLSYMEDRLIAVLPADHPLADSESIRISDLRDENFLFLPEDTLMYQLCVDLCRDAGFQPKASFTDYNGQNLINLVGKGMGCSLLMKRPAVLMTNHDTVVVDIVPSVNSSINLIYLGQHTLSVMCRYFWAFVKDQLS